MATSMLAHDTVSLHERPTGGWRRRLSSHAFGALAGCALAWLLAVGGALAQPSGRFAAAMRAYEGGEIESALDAFDAALHEPHNPPERVHAIQLHLGILYAIAGDDDRATRAFRTALALRPDTAVPPELAPAQRALFEQARDAIDGPIAVEATVDGVASPEAGTALHIRATHAPDGLVARFMVRASSADGRRSRPGGRGAPRDSLPRGEGAEPPPTDGAPWIGLVVFGSPAVLVIPALAWGDARALTVETRALDAYGGVLARSELTLRASAAHGEDVVAPDLLTVEPTPASDDTWVWAVVGVSAAVVIGVVLAVTLALTIGPEEFVIGPPEVRR